MADSLESNRYEQQAEKEHVSEAKSKRKVMSLVIGSVLLWVGLVVGGYFLADHYIQQSQHYLDKRITAVEANNEKQVKQMENELNAVHKEMLNVKSELVFIQEDLQLTGETLDGTDKTKTALQQRMQDLDKQLEELRKSIARLEDASR
ncbi:hypothetical protein LC040_08815 [Bacillus tianshenii]|nr:hypothetical protein LC040_08815 [Bacillus tianshenii]